MYCHIFGICICNHCLLSLVFIPLLHWGFLDVVYSLSDFVDIIVLVYICNGPVLCYFMPKSVYFYGLCWPWSM